MSGNEKQKLFKLATIAHKFNEAAMALFERPENIQKFRSAVRQEEMLGLNAATSAMEEAADIASQTGDPDDSMRTIIAEQSINFTDIFAAITARAMPEVDLSQMMPREARNKAVAEEFEKRGAKNLAKLCLK